MEARQRFSCKTESAGADRAKLVEKRADRSGKLIIGINPRDAPEAMRFGGADLMGGEDQMRGRLYAHQARQGHESNGRKAAELDFRLAELGGFRSKNKITKRREFHAAPEAVTADGSNGHALRGGQGAAHGMEPGERFAHTLGGVMGNHGARERCSNHR